MKELDPGHSYRLEPFDGGAVQTLTFMKREEFFPNEISYSGTNAQEVLRALIARVKYLDSQEKDVENEIILNSLRTALLAFEVRAARRHSKRLIPVSYDPEDIPTGPEGHSLFVEDLPNKAARKKGLDK